ncbi:hypothetical protein NDU88_006450 [Pleurodeles waltl]|uniref:Uncharacterized protein n=1 Tax=Pleurodeles waltl TaxID=8319 RepID=A0AAV7X0B5_PLEWA|nr:hypothetical protein NDU88_006450 [Pleurodeles waltl]
MPNRGGPRDRGPSRAKREAGSAGAASATASLVMAGNAAGNTNLPCRPSQGLAGECETQNCGVNRAENYFFAGGG